MSQPATGSRNGQATALAEVVEHEVTAALPLGGEVDVQIATARRYPRSIVTFRNTALEMATLDEDTASSCFYVLPRRNEEGKNIEGPSARLAEILASAWGHMRIQAATIGEDERFVTSRGAAWDLQNNVAIAYDVKRRITGRKGRYNDDMIGMTGNAGASIALRNAVLKVIPSSYWRPIYLACRKVAVGDQQTLGHRRAAMLEHFGKLGLKPEQVFAVVDAQGIEDITLERLLILKGIATALKEGDTTIEEAFAPREGADGPIPMPQAKQPAPAAQQQQAAPPAAETVSGDSGSDQREARSREMPSGSTGTVGGPSPLTLARVEEGKAGDKPFYVVFLSDGRRFATYNPLIAEQARALAGRKVAVPGDDPLAAPTPGVPVLAFTPSSNPKQTPRLDRVEGV
jgi:hypothetical protein